jgi:glutamate racemase
MSKIAIFDSGIGGLTVLHEALKYLPHEQFIYLADSDHAPYGNKPAEEVRGYIRKVVAFLNEQNIKALVVACNTATALMINELRDTYSFPVIGIEPAIKPALEVEPGQRVLVFATERTLLTDKFLTLKARLDTQHQVDDVPLQALVRWAEDLVFEEEAILRYLKQQTESLDLTTYGVCVLGCTHFPFFRNEIAQLFPRSIPLLDGSEGTVRQLLRKLGENIQMTGAGQINYFISQRPVEAILFAPYFKRLEAQKSD